MASKRKRLSRKMESLFQKTLHIYNRGNRKELICKDRADYFFLNNLIKHHFKKHKFDLICFCIMPNHYHILASQIGYVHISTVMQKLGSRYTVYINQKYGLVGHLFQSNYHAKAIVNKAQFDTVANYIYYNPKHDIYREYPYFHYNEIIVSYYSLNKFKDKGDPEGKPLSYSSGYGRYKTIIESLAEKDPEKARDIYRSFGRLS